MFIFKDTKLRANPFARYTDKNGTRHVTIPMELLEEIEEPAPPVDYDPLIYYRNEIDEAPYVLYTKKSDALIKVEHNDRINQTITGKEQSTLMPRASREFMLTFMEVQAQQSGISLEVLYAKNPGYQKVKDFDTQIKTLREKLYAVDDDMLAILSARNPV